MKRSIAMKCTQEQFDSIKVLLDNVVLLDDFKDCPYIVNNLGGIFGVFSNVDKYMKNELDREVYEEWNAQIFLEACGIINVGRYDIYQEIGALMDKARKQGINIKIIIE